MLARIMFWAIDVNLGLAVHGLQAPQWAGSSCPSPHHPCMQTPAVSMLGGVHLPRVSYGSHHIRIARSTRPANTLSMLGTLTALYNGPAWYVMRPELRVEVWLMCLLWII